MLGLVTAAPVTPSNTPGGYILTFAFPMLLFIVIGSVVYLLLFRPHKVPGHRDMAYAGSAAPETTVPDPGVARAAAVAGGLATAAGGGTGEALVEPSGAHLGAAQLEREAARQEAAAEQDAATDPERAMAEDEQARRLEREAQQERAQAGQEDDTEGTE